MNTEDMPQLPITSLAGIAGLTNLLNHLPLPSPLPATTTRGFLYSSGVAADVFGLLASQDEKLVSQLAHGLSQVSTENMWVFVYIYSISNHFCVYCISGDPTAVYICTWNDKTSEYLMLYWYESLSFRSCVHYSFIEDNKYCTSFPRLCIQKISSKPLETLYFVFK